MNYAIVYEIVEENGEHVGFGMYNYTLRSIVEMYDEDVRILVANEEVANAYITPKKTVSDDIDTFTEQLIAGQYDKRSVILQDAVLLVKELPRYILHRDTGEHSDYGRSNPYVILGRAKDIETETEKYVVLGQGCKMYAYTEQELLAMPNIRFNNAKVKKLRNGREHIISVGYHFRYLDVVSGRRVPITLNF